MSPVTFRSWLAALIALIWLSTTQAIGTMIGLFVAFSMALILLPLVAVVGYASSQLDPTMTAARLGTMALVIGGLFVLLLLIAAYLAVARGRMDSARLLAFHAALWTALPLICWLSLKSMADAWP